MKTSTRMLLTFLGIGFLTAILFPLYAGFFVEWKEGMFPLFLLGCFIAGAMVALSCFFYTLSLSKQVDLKTEELSYFNIQLEDIVKERTEEAKEKSKQLEELNKNLENEISRKTRALNDKLLKEERVTKAMIYILERAKRSKGELEKSKSELERKSEEMQAQAEELRSTNEQLIMQSEVLQASNKQLAEAEEKLEKFNEQLENEVKKRTEELEKAYKELKNLDEMKDNFLSSVSHELRTPLTSIKSYNQLMREGLLGPVSDKQKESLDIILNSTEHLIHLINNILNLSKYEAGKMQLNISKMDTSSLIKEVIKEFEPTLTSIGAKVICRGSVDVIKADAEKIKEVIRNLVSNSIKYKSERTLQIHIKLTQKKNQLLITISDNGIGISIVDQKNLFNKFFQADQSMTKKVEGTGLGLSILHHIVDLHGGTIEVQSKLRKGTRFTITLPKDSEAKTHETKVKSIKAD